MGTAIARIRKYADDYGRRIDDDHFGVLFNFCFAEDAPDGAARPYALRNRHDVDFVETSALGTAEAIAAAIPLHRRRRLQVRRPAWPEAIHDQLKRLGTEVIAVYVTRADSTQTCIGVVRRSRPITTKNSSKRPEP